MLLPNNDEDRGALVDGAGEDPPLERMYKKKIKDKTINPTMAITHHVIPEEPTPDDGGSVVLVSTTISGVFEVESTGGKVSSC